MRGQATALGCPRPALPVGELSRRLVSHALPPDITIRRQGHIGEYAVGAQRLHGIRIGFLRGSRSNAKETVLRIDGAQASIGIGFDPGDVVADRCHLPAGKSARWNHHGKVGLAARAGKGRSNITFQSLRRLDSENQHVLGKPALAATHARGNAQCKALLAEQGIATVTAAERPDGLFFRKMDDVFVVFIARPGHLTLSAIKRHTHGMQAGNEIRALAESIERLATHARHDAHADRDVGRVGQLHAGLRKRGADRPHGKRHHIHRAAAHAALEQRPQRAFHVRGIAPVVGRTRIVLVGAAYESSVFHPGDIGRIRQRQIAIRAQFRIEFAQCAVRYQARAQRLIFGLRPVAPVDACRLR